jgi:tripartite-type tricarboxylate transporter receptor subunit TctC
MPPAGIFAALAAVALSCASFAAWAQNKPGKPAETYPSRPIRMIVPYPAGGPTDIMARTLAQKIGDAWGQQVVVDNRGGANGVIAQEIAAKSAPDGYTIFVHTVAHVVNPMLYKVPYDKERDFVPVTLVASFPLMLVVHPALPATSVKELVALARSKPGQINYSSYGQGSIAQLAAEMFKSAEGLDIVHVVYKGAPQGLAAAVANEVQLTFPSVTTGAPQTKAGRLRGLAVTSRQRTPLLPDLPTMIEAGVRDFEATSWFGIFFPAGTPRPIVTNLYQETLKIVRLPDVKTLLDSQAFDVIGMGPDEFPQFIRAETRKYEKVVKTARIKVE